MNISWINKMIETPLFVSKHGSECPIAVGVNVNAFDGNSKIGMKVNWEGVLFVKWISQGSIVEYKLPESASKISAYPTPDMEKMVVIKFGEKVETPNNAVVLNDRGEEIFTPQIPIRISKEKWLPKGELYCFMQSGWSEYQDHIFFFLSIADTDWVETRYFNYKTMEWDLERYETWRL
jgi:hypothetical protein